MSAFLDRGARLGLALSAGAFAVFWLVDRSWHISLRDAQYFNGWVLAGCIAALLMLNLRKRVPILPFGRVRLWMVLHYYLGLVCVGAFLVHTGFGRPEAPMEWLLWILFVAVAVSGIFGALLNKFMPMRLEEHGERIIFERIPIFRAEIADEARALALESVEDGNTVSIADLYATTLASYFARPRNLGAHLLSSARPVRRILDELRSIDRYLDDAGHARLERLGDLVRAKDNLDFQYANGGVLKLWLFLHVPASWAMVVVILTHIVVAYAFSAGVP